MVALISYWESRGVVLDRRNGGRTEGKKRFFFFFQGWLGVGAMEKWFFDRECF